MCILVFSCLLHVLMLISCSHVYFIFSCVLSCTHACFIFSCLFHDLMCTLMFSYLLHVLIHISIFLMPTLMFLGLLWSSHVYPPEVQLMYSTSELLFCYVLYKQSTHFILYFKCLYNDRMEYRCYTILQVVNVWLPQELSQDLCFRQQSVIDRSCNTLILFLSEPIHWTRTLTMKLLLD